MSGEPPIDEFPSEDELRPEVDPVTGIDLSLIAANLKLTPWERILANDDAINFIDMMRTAMNQHHASASPTALPAA